MENANQKWPQKSQLRIKHTYALCINSWRHTINEQFLERCLFICPKYFRHVKSLSLSSSYSVFFQTIPEAAEENHKASMKTGESSLWWTNGKSLKLTRLINKNIGSN